MNPITNKSASSPTDVQSMTGTRVAVGILRQMDGSVLLCQRAADIRYPLLWEFPGGKVEPGETPEAALQRELLEELGIEAVIGQRFHNVQAHYDDGGLFDVSYYHVREWTGEITNKVFNDIKWVLVTQLITYDILKGNIEVCQMLSHDGLHA